MNSADRALSQVFTKAVVVNIAALVLGGTFIATAGLHFLGLLPVTSAIEGAPAALFMSALRSTGFLSFVKGVELLGGLIVAVPKTRVLGLLILAPVVVNILAFQALMRGASAVLQPAVLLVATLTALLLWYERRTLLRLIARDEIDGRH